MISTRTHGALDYLSAAALVAGPRLLGWRSALAGPLAAVGLGTAAYSLLTRYEWGVADALTMREHLALDALQGAAFCGAAALLDREAPEVRLALAGYGLFALAAAALTERAPEADWPEA
jgi:hypothetical protein